MDLKEFKVFPSGALMLSHLVRRARGRRQKPGSSEKFAGSPGCARHKTPAYLESTPKSKNEADPVSFNFIAAIKAYSPGFKSSLGVTL